MSSGSPGLWTHRLLSAVHTYVGSPSRPLLTFSIERFCKCTCGSLLHTWSGKHECVTLAPMTPGIFGLVCSGTPLGTQSSE